LEEKDFELRYWSVKSGSDIVDTDGDEEKEGDKGYLPPVADDTGTDRSYKNRNQMV
jgi:hypothetical protein